MPWKRKEEKKDASLFDVDVKAKRIEGVETLKASRLAALALEHCRDILAACPQRMAGSASSRTAAHMIRDILADQSDDCVITSVRCDERGYMGCLRLIAICAPVMLLLCWTGLPSIALLVALLSSLYLWNVFFLCRPTRRILERRVDMTNVHATIEPEGEVRHTIVFSAHHDSARMMNVPPGDRNAMLLSLYAPTIEPEGEVRHTIVFSAHHDSARMMNVPPGDRNAMLLSLYAPLVHFIVLTMTSLSLFVSEVFSGELLRFNLPPLSMGVLLALLTVSAPLHWKLFTLVGAQCSPGAGDNLVSCAILCTLARYFHWRKESGHGLADTLLVFASFDGEECGLCGSNAWYGSHRDLCRDAVVLNIDSPLRSSDLVVLTKDVNGLVDLSSSLASEVCQVAGSMGYDVRTGSLPLMGGASDAASAARAGLEAVTLMGIPLSGAASDIIHTKEDTLDKLDQHTLEEVVSICIKFVESRAVSREDTEAAKAPALQDHSRRFSLR